MKARNRVQRNGSPSTPTPQAKTPPPIRPSKHARALGNLGGGRAAAEKHVADALKGASPDLSPGGRPWKMVMDDEQSNEFFRLMVDAHAEAKAAEAMMDAMMLILDGPFEVTGHMAAQVASLRCKVSVEEAFLRLEECWHALGKQSNPAPVKLGCEGVAVAMSIPDGTGALRFSLPKAESL